MLLNHPDKNHCACQPNHPEEVECRSCGLDPLCRVLDYRETGVLHLRQPVRRGQTLFRAGDPCDRIYAVKSGSFQATVQDEDGSKISGFHLPGELMGTEGLADGTYPFTVRALEDSSVCVADYSHLQANGELAKKTQQAIITMLSREVAFCRWQHFHQTRQNAEQRLAAFFLELVQRRRERGLVYRRFRLTMSRAQIARLLGLAPETLSRMTTRLRKLGVLSVTRHELQVHNPERLEELAGVPRNQGLHLPLSDPG
jgi:CRP/FNR family transcriptional regulator